MPLRRLNLGILLGRERATALMGALIAVAVMAAGAHKLGFAAVAVPAGVLAVLLVIMHPRVAVGLPVVLAILCEGESQGETSGLFTFASEFYHPLYKHLTALDALVAVAVIAVTLDLIRRRRPVQVPRELRLPLVLLVLGMLSGVLVGREGGKGLSSLVLAENVLGYLIVLPLAVANLDLHPRQVRLLLAGAFGLAALKGLLGVAASVAGHGSSFEGHSTLTYLEPTANWVVMLALLGVFAAIVARMRPPRWMLLATPLLVASLLLSYRRSFWIATVLGLLLVLVIALSPVGRRMLIPTALFIAAAIWLLGSLSFQSQSPIVKRAVSLSPTSLQNNAQDRYRLDERANVLAEIKRHPITGLGILVPWHASARTLSVEHENGREYVHFAALWFWLKLGIMGLLAYLSLLVAAASGAWRVWRRSRGAITRAFGLASLCGLVGLLVAETTATFTGVDPRFTLVFGAQIGLLALSARQASAPALAE